MNEIETNINNLDNIKNWNDKIISIKSIKENIKFEEEKINELLLQLDNPKKLKMNSNDIESVIQKINESSNIEIKIKNYHKLSHYINKLNNELFSN